jgi:hypothetical protein
VRGTKRTRRACATSSFSGSGKSSIGRRVADRLDRPFVDGDDELEAFTGGGIAAEIEVQEGGRRAGPHVAAHPLR